MLKGILSLIGLSIHFIIYGRKKTVEVGLTEKGELYFFYIGLITFIVFLSIYFLYRYELIFQIK